MSNLPNQDAEFPDREFWAYTRSRDPQVLSILAGIPNLSIFLSADRDNWCSMLQLSEQFPDFADGGQARRATGEMLFDALTLGLR